jgi:TonB family protein
MRAQNISGLFGMAYLPMLLISGNDPHPQPGKSVRVPRPTTAPIYAPGPKYPLAARERHWEGVGLLEVHLMPNRSVRSVKILRSTGHSILDDDAAQVLRGWQFTPDSADTVRVPVTYSLHCTD